MTGQELEIVDDLAVAFNKFKNLERVHSWELQEFMHAIHACQVIVMARTEQRALNAEMAKEGLLITKFPTSLC